MLYGGLPATIGLSDVNKTDYLKRLFLETFLKDIIDRNNIQNDSSIKTLLEVLSSSIGALINPNKLSNTFKSLSNTTISAPTINKYIEYFLNSFLISESKKYDVKGKKYIATPSKYYFSDLGIRNVILNFRKIEKTHLFENLIYNELLRRGYSIDVGNVVSRTKTQNGKEEKNLEIDFVCNLDDTRYYIQAAYSLPDNDKWEQESKSLNLVDDCFKKIIICKDKLRSHYNNDGILVLDIFDFLLDENSLKI